MAKINDYHESSTTSSNGVLNDLPKAPQRVINLDSTLLYMGFCHFASQCNEVTQLGLVAYTPCQFSLVCHLVCSLKAQYFQNVMRVGFRNAQYL
ncbi:hypothetical protein L3X38_035064 [Prunus dulcis]|uniref:Uncharacterized protein n=1 Tax=Prunus dulcis TaxID=3755 RepID=A0AAD4YYG8_PRUDU|nr:hypothetical protein L3X38_035064 [Prunus dulcis]